MKILIARNQLIRLQGLAGQSEICRVHWRLRTGAAVSGRIPQNPVFLRDLGSALTDFQLWMRHTQMVEANLTTATNCLLATPR